MAKRLELVKQEGR